MPAASRAAGAESGPRLDKVKYAYFSKPTMIPEYHGSYARITSTPKPEGGAVIGSNTCYAKSLHICDNCLLVDGTFWMPLEGGNITGYVYD